jgi:acyl transferase domain-containing protein
MRGVCTAKLLHSSVYKGAMVSVGLSQTGMREILKAFPHDSTPLVIACHNSPRNVTVSGENSQIDALIALLNEAKIFCRKLKVDVAYHSPQMKQVHAEYINSIQDIEPGPLNSEAPIMISSVTGKRISTNELKQPEYWAKNMVSPVQFVEAVEHICASNVLRKKLDGSHLNNLHVDVCVEIGPHPALSGPVRDIASSKDRSITYLASIRRNASALNTLLETAGRLYCLGYSVDIQRINDDTSSDNRTDLVSLCDLPEYPFDHSKSYLHESRISKGHRLRSQPKLDLLGKTAADWNPMEAKWNNFIKISELPWVDDHKVGHTSNPFWPEKH